MSYCVDQHMTLELGIVQELLSAAFIGTLELHLINHFQSRNLRVANSQLRKLRRIRHKALKAEGYFGI